jgi:hypothetical protein
VIHKFLFYQQGNRIQTFHYRDQQFEPILYKGDKSQTTEAISFWEWWEKNASYIDGVDEVDFCFLGDEAENQLKPAYKTVQTSSWSTKELEAFLNLHVAYPKVLLKQGVNGEFLFNNTSSRDIPYEYVGENVLFIETYPSEDIIHSKKIREEIKDMEEESVLSKYYREKTRSY